MDRIGFLTSRDERAAAATSAAPTRLTVAEALDPATVVALRVQCHWDARQQRRWTVVGYTHRHHRINYPAAEQDELFAWARRAYPGVDWNRDHHIDLTGKGGIFAAPEAWEDGFLPDDDSSFGDLAPAVMLSADSSWRTPPAPFPFPTPVRRAA